MSTVIGDLYLFSDGTKFIVNPNTDKVWAIDWIVERSEARKLFKSKLQQGLTYQSKKVKLTTFGFTHPAGTLVSPGVPLRYVSPSPQQDPYQYDWRDGWSGGGC